MLIQRECLRFVHQFCRISADSGFPFFKKLPFLHYHIYFANKQETERKQAGKQSDLDQKILAQTI